MTAQDDNLLTRSQLAAFQTVLHQGAEHASGALDRWVQKPTRISFDSVEQLPLHEATSLIDVLRNLPGRRIHIKGGRRVGGLERTSWVADGA